VKINTTQKSINTNIDSGIDVQHTDIMFNPEKELKDFEVLDDSIYPDLEAIEEPLTASESVADIERTLSSYDQVEEPFRKQPSHINRYIRSIRSENRKDFLTFTASVTFLALVSIAALLIFQDVNDEKTLTADTSESNQGLPPTENSSRSETIILDAEIASKENLDLVTDTTIKQPAAPIIKQVPQAQTEKNVVVVDVSSTVAETTKTFKSESTGEQNRPGAKAPTKITTTTQPKESTKTPETEPEPAIQTYISSSVVYDEINDTTTFNMSVYENTICADYYEYDLTTSSQKTITNLVDVDSETCSTNWPINFLALEPDTEYELDFKVTSTDGDESSKIVNWTTDS